MADYHVDASNKRLGRLASEIAMILQGKKHPDYEPRVAGKDRVLVAHAEKLTVSGNKAEQKIYYRHTGYMGHLKERTFQDAFARDPKEVLRRAVRHMLPKNFLNQKRMNNLLFVTHDEK